MINNISQVRVIIRQVIGHLTIAYTHNYSMLRSIWWVTILCTILENLYFLDLIQISNLLTLPSYQTTMIVTMIASKSLWENFNDLKTWKKELRNNGRKEFEKLYCMKVNISRMWKMSKNWSNTLKDISDQRIIYRHRKFKKESSRFQKAKSSHKIQGLLLLLNSCKKYVKMRKKGKKESEKTKVHTLGSRGNKLAICNFRLLNKLW